MSELINSEIYAQMKKGTEGKAFEKERGGKLKTKKKGTNPKSLIRFIVLDYEAKTEKNV